METWMVSPPYPTRPPCLCVEGDWKPEMPLRMRPLRWCQSRAENSPASFRAYNMGQTPWLYHSMSSTGRTYRPGETDQRIRDPVLWSALRAMALLPFGFGLSYTTFEYGDIQLSQTSFTQNQNNNSKVTVKNTGKTVGCKVVQMYIRDKTRQLSAKPVQKNWRDLKSVPPSRGIQNNHIHNQWRSFEIL